MSTTTDKFTVLAAVLTTTLCAACPFPDQETSGGDPSMDASSGASPIGTSTAPVTEGASDTGAQPTIAMTSAETTTNGTNTTGDGGNVTTEAPTADLPPAGCDPQPGEAMGPCRAAVDPLGPCDDGLLCLSADVGSFCQPPCQSCASDEHGACVEALSGPGRFTCHPDQECSLPCSSDEECTGGTVCGEAFDRTKTCVWPHDDPPPHPPTECVPNPGDTFGPCLDNFGCNGGFCLSTPSGSMCLPPCGACDGPNECVDDIGGDLGGAFCLTNEHCAVTCGFTNPEMTESTCQHGATCDPDTLFCVWP